jgi:hypothetical protein
MGILNLFKKEKFVEVKVLELPAKVRHGSKQTNLVIYIHLLESSSGRRKIENISGVLSVPEDMMNDYVKSSELYNKKISRWLNGRHDPEIPRYSEISEEDTANALRGKI